MILIQRNPTLPADAPAALVRYYVIEALQQARQTPGQTYQVSLSGWGVNAREMTEWFKDAPGNVRVPVAFMPL